MCMGKDGDKLGHVFVEMAREVGQNGGGEGLRTGPSLWIEGGSGSNVNVWKEGREKVILKVGCFPLIQREAG